MATEMWRKLPWPHNLIAAVFGHDVEINQSNFEEALPQVLASDRFTEKDRIIVSMRFREGQKTSTIGNTLGLTGGAVRQLELRLRYKLHQPQSGRLLVNGLQRCKEMDEEAARQKQAEVECILRRIRNDLPLLIGRDNAAACEAYFLAFGDLSITHLKLNPRSETTLKDNDHNRDEQITVESLCFLSEKELLNFRGCGSVTVSDIIATMAKWGFTLRGTASKH